MSFRLQRVIAVFVVGGFVMSQLSYASPRGSQQVPPKSPASHSTSTEIQEGFKSERELQGNENHSYPLTLKANEYVKLVVEQKGIDVVVRLLGPDGKIIQEIDSPNGTQGEEPLSYIVEQAGNYTLEVTSLEKTARAGKYELKLEALHLATAQDRATFEIERWLAKGEQLKQAGKYNDALPLATQALEKSERILGKEHLLVATSLNNLAGLYQAKGDYPQAEPLLLRSLAIREKALGPDHPDVARSLNSLASLYRDKGDYPQAEPLYQRSLAIKEKTLGPDHPDVATSLNNLAVLYRAKGETTQAISYLTRSNDTIERDLMRNLATGSEHQKALYLKITAGRTDQSMTYLTSGRDLLRLAVKIESTDQPLVLADPDYQAGAGPKLLGQNFAPLARLAGTNQEGHQLKTIFPNAQLRLEGEATEAVLKQAIKPELVHIATHGYFLEDATQDRLPEPESRSLVLGEGKKVDVEQLRANNPLLRSWLFFAGANKGGSEDNDGTMTALEAAQLNLWGTKLVVLSACETGLGQVKNGDGVYGLRRALVLAGSESQMISLWQVSDDGTKELMANFYRRLKSGEGRSDALQNTQLQMMKNAKWRHPFYWAAFIQSGEWANLEGKR